jgi:hypothetical protein
MTAAARPCAIDEGMEILAWACCYLTDRISAARALRGSRRAAPQTKDKARRLTQ